MRRIFKMLISFTTGCLFWHFTGMSWRVWTNRQGTVGGEILFIPLMILMFCLGWSARDQPQDQGIKKELNNEPK